MPARARASADPGDQLGKGVEYHGHTLVAEEMAIEEHAGMELAKGAEGVLAIAMGGLEPVLLLVSLRQHQDLVAPGAARLPEGTAERLERSKAVVLLRWFVL